MTRLGLIGGTGLDRWGGEGRELVVRSIFGDPSTKPVEYALGDLQLVFLSRHGRAHELPPHAVNYRANIDIFRRLEVKHVVAVNAVGTITPKYAPGGLSVPDQLIDYTWGRAHSYSMSASEPLKHIEFSSPFDESMRCRLVQAAGRVSVAVMDGGCIGVTQGPRLETAAEIARLRRDGCDLVGMTSMPEASLAREAGIAYASLCVHSNWAAGVSAQETSMESIEKTLAASMSSVRQLLEKLFEEFSDVR
jgi:5'-methylthioinosine phosphorylase